MKTVRNFIADIVVEIGNKTPEEIRNEIIEAGGSIGKISLISLLSGERTNVSGYEVYDSELGFVGQEEPVVVAEPTAVVIEMHQPTVVEVPEPVVTPTQAKFNNAWMGALIPKEKKLNLKSIRRGTKRSKVFELLAHPGAGITIAELMTHTGETEGSIKVIISQKAKKKGYDVLKETIDGRGIVHFLAVDGVKIAANDILYAEDDSTGTED